jgi:hypothetical protein
MNNFDYFDVLRKLVVDATCKPAERSRLFAHLLAVSIKERDVLIFQPRPFLSRLKLLSICIFADSSLNRPSISCEHDYE